LLYLKEIESSHYRKVLTLLSFNEMVHLAKIERVNLFQGRLNEINYTNEAIYYLCQGILKGEVSLYH
jgi:hypothetical protein